MGWYHWSSVFRLLFTGSAEASVPGFPGRPVAGQTNVPPGDPGGTWKAKVQAGRLFVIGRRGDAMAEQPLGLARQPLGQLIVELPAAEGGIVENGLDLGHQHVAPGGETGDEGEPSVVAGVTGIAALDPRGRPGERLQRQLADRRRDLLIGGGEAYIAPFA